MQALARTENEPMDQQILQTLQEIRGILTVLVVMVGVLFALWVVNWISNIVAQFKSAWENDFINRASKYFESGELDKLNKHCSDKLRKFPNHSKALWWLARSKMEAREREEAVTLFERLLILEPSWKEDTIDPYLNHLRAGSSER